VAINVKLALYRGPLSDLASLASTGQAGVLAWTTDTNELYVDSGSGTGIGAGNAWLRVAQDLVAVNAQTGTTYTLLATDRSKLVTLSNASPVAVTVPVATGASFPAGFITKIQNIGAGTATLTPTTSTINGAASFALLQYQSIDLVSDGTNWHALSGVTVFPVTTPVTNEFATGMNSSGVLSLAQPAFTNLSGVLTEAQLPATISSGSNLTLIDCGTF
jgi:hypothetical protein